MVSKAGEYGVVSDVWLGLFAPGNQLCCKVESDQVLESPFFRIGFQIHDMMPLSSSVKVLDTQRDLEDARNFPIHRHSVFERFSVNQITKLMGRLDLTCTLLVVAIP